MAQERATPLGAINAAGWVPHTEIERDAVRAQMERILSHDLFKHSRRYPALLRFVVEHALDNDMDTLKERRLGIEVFGREADYDTNLDPVVRITAGEIRKRIAQYYHAAGHEEEIRIDLPVGSYAPEFHPAAEARTPFDRARPPQHRRAAAAIATAALITAALGGLVWTRPWASRPALEQFWSPVLASSSPVLLCIGRSGPAVDAEERTPAIQSDGFWMPSLSVALSDATTLSRLTGLLHAEGKRYNVQGAAFTTLSQLRDGPVILIGAFNNPWTMKLAGPQRYTFVQSSTRDFSWIQDGLHPERRDWTSDWTLPYLADTEDYAIVSRLLHPTTERVVVIAAGLGRYGTMAAGEFLTDEGYMDALRKAAPPPGWERRNLQVVLATSVIKGNSGPPRVVATHSW